MQTLSNFIVSSYGLLRTEVWSTSNKSGSIENVQRVQRCNRNRCVNLMGKGSNKDKHYEVLVSCSDRIILNFIELHLMQNNGTAYNFR